MGYKSPACVQVAPLGIQDYRLINTVLNVVETWKTNKEIENKLRGSEGRCLRKILRVRWPPIISNKDIQETTGLDDINKEITKR